MDLESSDNDDIRLVGSSSAAAGPEAAEPVQPTRRSRAKLPVPEGGGALSRARSEPGPSRSQRAPSRSRSSSPARRHRRGPRQTAAESCTVCGEDIELGEELFRGLPQHQVCGAAKHAEQVYFKRSASKEVCCCLLLCLHYIIV